MVVEQSKSSGVYESIEQVLHRWRWGPMGYGADRRWGYGADNGAMVREDPRGTYEKEGGSGREEEKYDDIYTFKDTHPKR